MQLPCTAALQLLGRLLAASLLRCSAWAQAGALLHKPPTAPMIMQKAIATRTLTPRTILLPLLLLQRIVQTASPGTRLAVAWQHMLRPLDLPLQAQGPHLQHHRRQRLQRVLRS